MLVVHLGSGIPESHVVVILLIIIRNDLSPFCLLCAEILYTSLYLPSLCITLLPINRATRIEAESLSCY